MNEVWEYAEEYILQDRGRNGHGGWRTCCGKKQKVVERAHAEWFPGSRKTAPPSVADVKRSPYTAAWHEAMKIELDGHKTTGAYKTATQGRRHIGEMWVFSYNTDKDGLILKTKARLVVGGF